MSPAYGTSSGGAARRDHPKACRAYSRLSQRLTDAAQRCSLPPVVSCLGVVVCIVVGLTGVFPTAALGQSPSDTGQQHIESDLQRAREQLERKSDTLDILAKREAQAQAKSRAFRDEMELLAEVRDRLQEKYRLLDREYTASERQMRDLEERYEFRREVLSRMLASLYRSKALTGQPAIGGGGAGLERRRVFARLVSEAQSGYLLADADSLVLWESRRTGLAQSRRQVQIAATDKQREQQQKERLAARSEREAFAYRQQREQHLTEIEQIQREALILSELIDRLAALQRAQSAVDYDFARWKGRLHWPLNGTVKSTVGTRVDPRYGTQTSETGIFISGSAGQPVANAADGEVAYTGRRRGLGDLVIVGHGAGYFSIFAHLGEISVIEGQVLRAGDPIGTAGESHPRFGPGVFFELRHEREILDPLEWLK